MSRKTFLIWGLVIIQIYPIGIAVLQYLGFSRLIDVKTIGFNLAIVLVVLPLIAFVAILFVRFIEIGRRKRALLLCIPLYIALTFVGGLLTIPYTDYIITYSGAQDRFYGAISDWAEANSSQEMTWTVKQKLDYILIMLPFAYLSQLGLFALLWFGSLDPRKPSQGRAPSPFRGRWLERFSKRGSRRGPLAERA
jgi:hypothetical protein